MADPICLNHHATTPCLASVQAAMAPWLDIQPLLACLGALERAREQIARRVGAHNHRVVFTSGATESNNLAIRGCLTATGTAVHMITVVTEHASILESGRYAMGKGASLTVLPVGTDGRVDPDAIRRALRPNTVLVSVMAVNNEIGVMHELSGIAGVCREAGVVLHTDASQILFTSLDASVGLDLISLSGHKIGAPQGIGALVVREGLDLVPHIVGGGQQWGLRAGTVPVALAVGLGEAASTILDPADVRRARDLLACLLEDGVPGMRWNGSCEHRAPHNLNVVLPGVDTAALVEVLADQVLLSTGSACSAGDPAPSHVIEALGVRGRDLASTLRVSLGPGTSQTDVRRAAAAIIDACGRLRS